ncbi:hypothetical protein BDN72DRAFT_36312 [Pluteus cervinus]|uniref:Uncharacterized protein n=1 Tax=Pluteus cervinus TaxID=181527 RepID=A0ACD3BHZ7_9AGAR|nr:hypothetical protein BDN72DRAFT_36312 [Pluteus cervinus]
MSPPPDLPSVLPSQPAIQDVDTTPEDLKAAQALGKVTSPTDTAIVICAFEGCFRLYPSHERLMLHRKRDHNSVDETKVVTWNN